MVLRFLALKIAGKKYVVRHDWKEQDASKKYYLTIIEALEDGSFIKLKRCKQCGKFFIADRLSDRFCSPTCSKATFGGESAKNRVYAIREGQKNLDKVLKLSLQNIPQSIGETGNHGVKGKARKGSYSIEALETCSQASKKASEGNAHRAR